MMENPSAKPFESPETMRYKVEECRDEPVGRDYDDYKMDQSYWDKPVGREHRDIVEICQPSWDPVGEEHEFAEECHSSWDRPLKGRIYYHPIDDDPQYLGCTQLIRPVERVRPIYPKPNIIVGKEPMEKITTFHREFGTAPIMDFQGIAKRIRKYEPPSVPIASETEYRKIYYAKPIDPAKAIIPERQKPLDGPMEKISSYKRTFKGYDQEQMNYSKPINYAPKRPKLERPPFAGSSTTKDTFKGHFSVARRDPIRPKRGALAEVMSGHTLNYETTQKMEFIPKCGRRPPPSHSKYDADPYLIRPEKADVSLPMSSMKEQFIEHHEIIPVCAIRPKRMPVSMNVPMASGTSYAEHFWQRKPEKQYTRPEWSIRKPFTAPTQEMEKGTTYESQFKKPPPTARTQSLRPERIPLQFGTEHVIPRETTTQAQFRAPPKGDYKGHSFMPRRVYVKSDDHVDYITSTQKAFKGVTAPRTKPIEVSRLAELQLRYKDKRIANRTTYREVFGVDYYFIPEKPPARERERCMYKLPEAINPGKTCINRMTQPTVQHVEVA